MVHAKQEIIVACSNISVQNCGHLKWQTHLCLPVLVDESAKVDLGYAVKGFDDQGQGMWSWSVKTEWVFWEYEYGNTMCSKQQESVLGLQKAQKYRN